MKFVVTSGTTGELGGKGYALARMTAERLPVPAWFALSPNAFDQSVSPVQRAAIKGGNVDDIRKVLIWSELSIPLFILRCWFWCWVSWFFAFQR